MISTSFINSKATYMSGRGALPIMTYKGKLAPKGVPFSGFRFIKRCEFHKIRYVKGLAKFLILKGYSIKIFLTGAPYGCIILFIRHYMKIAKRLPFLNLRSVIKVCESGTFFSIKRYTRGTFSIKTVYKR